MTKVFLLKNSAQNSDIAEMLRKNGFLVSYTEDNQELDDIFSQINNEMPDVILID